MVTLVFDAAGEKTYELVGKIPVGSTVTVTEVYSGAAYSSVSGVSQQTEIVSAEEAAQVAFENDYNDDDKGGGSVTNTFNYSKSEEEWSWSKVGTSNEN